MGLSAERYTEMDGFLFHSTGKWKEEKSFKWAEAFHSQKGSRMKEIRDVIVKNEWGKCFEHYYPR